jgi:hypothetical protein
MKTALLVVSFLALSLAAGDSQAKQGVIVKGLNGTKWCCPDGKISDRCEKGAASIPVGGNCNFASRSVPFNPGFTPVAGAGAGEPAHQNRTGEKTRPADAEAPAERP